MKKSKILFAGLIAATVFGFNTLRVDAVGKTYVESFPENVTRTQIITYLNGQEDDGELAPVNYMTDESGTYLLYCSDRSVAINGATPSDVLTKDKKLDYKIAYLLKNGYPNKSYISGITGYNFSTSNDTSPINGVTANDLANLWITQVGLWSLQGKVLDSHNILSSNGLYIPAENEKSYIFCNGTSSADCSQIGGSNLKQYVITLVNAANSAKDPESASFKMNFENKWELGNGVYKSSPIHFEWSNINEGVHAANISMQLDGAPEGTKVYSGNEEITNKLNEVPNTVDGIYITVPSSQVSSGNVNFKVTANSDYVYDAAYQYIDKENGYQPSVLVGPETKQLNNVMLITIVPDTASIISKSIYFVGFILLTFGAGIIYINIKHNNEEV